MQDFDRTGETDSTLGEHTQNSVDIRTQGEGAMTHWRLNQTYLLVLESLLQRWGPAVAYCKEKDIGSRSSGKYSLV